MAGYVYGIPRTAHLAKPTRRRRSWSWSRLAGPLAAVAGHVTRLGLAVGRRLPAIGFPVLSVVGMAMIWLPLGVLTAAAFCYLLDRRAR